MSAKARSFLKRSSKLVAIFSVMFAVAASMLANMYYVQGYGYQFYGNSYAVTYDKGKYPARYNQMAYHGSKDIYVAYAMDGYLYKAYEREYDPAAYTVEYQDRTYGDADYSARLHQAAYYRNAMYERG